MYQEQIRTNLALLVGKCEYVGSIRKRGNREVRQFLAETDSILWAGRILVLECAADHASRLRSADFVRKVIWLSHDELVIFDHCQI